MLADELMRFAIDNWSYETEYDGRNETWCFFCNTEQHRDGEMHKSNCLHVRAVEAQELDCADVHDLEEQAKQAWKDDADREATTHLGRYGH